MMQKAITQISSFPPVDSLETLPRGPVTLAASGTLPEQQVLRLGKQLHPPGNERPTSDE